MATTSPDHAWMVQALRLAERGAWGTHPNPRVGCVIVRDDIVVGQGFHAAAGTDHAEVVALGEAAEKARGATVYLTLEPCAHHGRTPPCADALVQAGVARVVTAMADPDPRVAGRGHQRLRAAGIAVDSGLLEASARSLNAGFVSRHERGRPWLRVKSALSLDGRSALADGASTWITGQAARADVQRWRARSDAILTGIGTVRDDDPRLDVRLEGASRQPVRVVADSGWRTPVDARMLRHGGPVWVAGNADGEPPSALTEVVECLPMPAGPGGIDLATLMAELARREINEVHVEAGATLCGTLLEAGLVDEWLLYQAPVVLGEGGAGAFVVGPLDRMEQRFRWTVVERRAVGEDLRHLLRPLDDDPSGVTG